MISKVFVAYMVMSLGAVPLSSVANPITPGPNDAAANPTMLPSNANAEHPSGSSAETLGNTSTTLAGNTASPANSAGTSTKELPPNAASVAHSPTPASNVTASGSTPQAVNASSAPAHGPASESTLKVANSTAPEASSKAHDDVHVKNMPAAKVQSDGQPVLATNPTCNLKKKSNGIENHHCEKALEKIVYAANSTLDKFSSVIFANYKTCNINIYKPRNATLPKAQVGSMVRNITERCHSVGGVLFRSPKIAITVERATAENVYQLDSSICAKEQCPLTQSDCLSAFYQIPLDTKGIFTFKNLTHSFARVTSGNCTVTVSTTDYSDFELPRRIIYPTMKKLYNDCGRHPGKIYLTGGASGLNGDLKISIRPSNKDLCE